MWLLYCQIEHFMYIEYFLKALNTEKPTKVHSTALCALAQPNLGVDLILEYVPNFLTRIFGSDHISNVNPCTATIPVASFLNCHAG